MDAQRRKEWSKKHGHDTYGRDNSEYDEGELKLEGRKKRKQGQASTVLSFALTNIPTTGTVLSTRKG